MLRRRLITGLTLLLIAAPAFAQSGDTSEPTAPSPADVSLVGISSPSKLATAINTVFDQEIVRNGPLLATTTVRAQAGCVVRGTVNSGAERYRFDMGGTWYTTRVQYGARTVRVCAENGRAWGRKSLQRAARFITCKDNNAGGAAVQACMRGL